MKTTIYIYIYFSKEILIILGLNLISITTSLNTRISLVQREATSKTNAKYQKDNRSQTLERYRRYKDHRVRTRA